MSKTRLDELIRDLFGLYSRYGRVEFERAIKTLETGEQIGSLLGLMRAAQNSFVPSSSNIQKPVTAQKRKKSPRERLDEFLAGLKNRDDDKSNLIARFVSDIAERRLLRSGATLRDYIKTLGIAQDAKMERQLVARKIGEVLCGDIAKARDHMTLAVQIGAEKSTLQAWSDIIVKDKH